MHVYGGSQYLKKKELIRINLLLDEVFYILVKDSHAILVHIQYIIPLSVQTHNKLKNRISKLLPY